MRSLAPFFRRIYILRRDSLSFNTSKLSKVLSKRYVLATIYPKGELSRTMPVLARVRSIRLSFGQRADKQRESTVFFRARNQLAVISVR